MEPTPTLPPAFTAILLTHLKRRYLSKGRADTPWNRRDTEYFAKGIMRLNRDFTFTRGDKAMNYFNDPVLRSGYLAYFLPVNAVKAMAILDDFSRAPLPARLRVADIGAGPLTLTLGLVFHLAQRLACEPAGKKILLEVDAFEQNGKILGDGRTLLADFLDATGLNRQITLSLNTHIAPLYAGLRRAGGYDIILFGNILNEFERREDQQRLVLPLVTRHTRPGANLLFVEPGSKKFTRDLQALRDALIADTDFRVIAPCLHQHECPLNLTAKSDWCNFTRRWSAPDFIRDFDAITDMKKSHLLYSYLLMRCASAPAVKFPRTAFVAISDLMRDKGRCEIIGCGPAGRVRFIRSHRDETEANRDFGGLHRGSRFKVAGFSSPEEFALNKTVGVKTSTAIDRHE